MGNSTASDILVNSLRTEIYGKPIFNKTPLELKTWEDVCMFHNIKSEDVLPYLVPKTKLEKSVNAVVKINYISKALNESWQADFDDVNQKKYYLWFKKLSGRWLVYDDFWDAVYASVGLGFYFKDRETALYAGNTFLDIFTDYLP